AAPWEPLLQSGRVSAPGVPHASRRRTYAPLRRGALCSTFDTAAVVADKQDDACERDRGRKREQAQREEFHRCGLCRADRMVLASSKSAREDETVIAWEDGRKGHEKRRAEAYSRTGRTARARFIGVSIVRLARGRA